MGRRAGSPRGSTGWPGWRWFEGWRGGDHLGINLSACEGGGFSCRLVDGQARWEDAAETEPSDPAVSIGAAMPLDCRWNCPPHKGPRGSWQGRAHPTHVTGAM